MRLKDVFIIEGAHDAEFRAQAQQAFDTLRKNLENSPASAWKQEVMASKVFDTRTSWQFVRPIDNDMPEDLSIHFALVPEGEGFPQAMFSRRGPKKPGGIIFIFFAIPEDRYARVLENPEKAKEVARINAVKMLDASRTPFIHEYMHYIDRSRTKGDVLPSSMYRDKGRTEYFAHPLEMNAFMQEMFDQLEQAAKKNPKILGNNINEFYRNFVSLTMHSNPAFYAHIRQRNIPRLKKRVAQLYNDIKDSTSG